MTKPKTKYDLLFEQAIRVHPKDLFERVIIPFMIRDTRTPAIARQNAVANIKKDNGAERVPLILMCGAGVCMQQMELTRVDYLSNGKSNTYTFTCANCETVASTRRNFAANNQKWMGRSDNRYDLRVSRSQIFDSDGEGNYRSDVLYNLFQFSPPNEPLHKLVEMTAGKDRFTTFREATGYEKLAYYAVPAGLKVPPQIK